MKLLNFLNRIIEYGFYAIFLLVPIVFTSDTSELFEFNKLWITFAFTVIIAVAWFSKMVVEKQVKIQRTPLDLPILLFLASQVLSTIFSIDKHVSLWGYYSRFNGGLYSIITYIFLYYAFVSNLANLKIVKGIIKVSLISGAIVALWGLPSHFGYDPTCLVFRGTFDVSCWTNEFQPKVRIFSSMGQPDWMAAYLTILLPISIVMFFESLKFTFDKAKKLILTRKNLINAILYLLLSALFYADLMYTASKSGALAGWFAIVAVVGVYFVHTYKSKIPENKPRKFIPVYLFILFIILTFLTTIPFAKFQKYTLPQVIEQINTKPASPSAKVKAPQPAPVAHLGELGGTDSSRIRMIVWEGALGIWKSSPLFGSGVETFAYAYYNHRPVAHNMTSEWNFLYNKAHNEFLNYLATTGLFGLGSYLFFIVMFLLGYYKAVRKLHKENGGQKFMAMALVASFIAILITNFFGFSVVITNIYLFTIPAFTFVILGLINSQKALTLPKNSLTEKDSALKISTGQSISVVVLAIAGLYLLVILFIFWNADRDYAYGMNLDQARQYQQARPYLVKAVEERPGEPTFRSEYAVNTAILADLFAQQKDSTQSAEVAQNLAKEASLVVENLTASYPKNVVFWKAKTRVYYSLSQMNPEQVDPRYLSLALEAIRNAANFAPTDANIMYNYAVLTGQAGDINKAVELLQKVVKLKPDYQDAYFALGIFYEQLASNNMGQIVNRDYHNKAVEEMNFILKHLAPNDERARNTLASWEKK
jgi:putative inorganic carbon (hco3(-)) transporter